MHKVEIRREIVERVLARRGKLHLYESLDPKRTALLVIDPAHRSKSPPHENVIQQFGDVLTANEALSFLDLSGSAQAAHRP